MALIVMSSFELCSDLSVRRRIRRLIPTYLAQGLIALSPLATPRAGSAQAIPQAQQQPRITLQSRSELVQVPVVVTDAKGQRAKDLAADDFTTLENSKPVAIKHFERIHGEPSRASNQIEPGLFSNVPIATTSPPPITIFLVDSLNTTVADQKRACEEMAKILSSPVPGPTAIWQLGPKGITVVQDFTSSQQELAAAVQRIVVARSAQDQLTTTAVADLRPYFNGRTERDYSGYVNEKIDVETEEVSNQLAVEDADRITLETILRIARALRSVEGRKSLVWMTGG